MAEAPKSKMQVISAIDLPQNAKVKKAREAREAKKK